MAPDAGGRKTFQLSFSDVSVKVTGSENWINAQ
jgi:hypothetical protein